MKKWKFNQCPVCGGAPDGLNIDIFFLRYPKGVFREGGREITLKFYCHKKKNVARALGITQDELDIVTTWDVYDYEPQTVTISWKSAGEPTHRKNPLD